MRTVAGEIDSDRLWAILTLRAARLAPLRRQLLTQLIEQEFSSASGHLKNKRAPEGTLRRLMRTVAGEIDSDRLWAILTLRAARLAPLRRQLLTQLIEQEFSSASGHLKNKRAPEGTLVFLARPERFELPTARFVAEYSIQLSYGRVVCCYILLLCCGGEGGIRTLEGLLTLTPLAGERFRPLSHLSEFL